MKINCLSCGFKIELDDAYSDYDGQVKCYACGALLDVKLSEGCIKAVKLLPLAGMAPPPKSKAQRPTGG